MFYNEYVISENTFWQWKNNAREEGHKISVLSLKRFYFLLTEPYTIKSYEEKLFKIFFY